jgi:hypothetical protein
MRLAVLREVERRVLFDGAEIPWNYVELNDCIALLERIVEGVRL